MPAEGLLGAQAAQHGKRVRQLLLVHLAPRPLDHDLAGRRRLCTNALGKRLGIVLARRCEPRTPGSRFLRSPVAPPPSAPRAPQPSRHRLSVAARPGPPTPPRSDASASMRRLPPSHFVRPAGTRPSAQPQSVHGCPHRGRPWRHSSRQSSFTARSLFASSASRARSPREKFSRREDRDPFGELQ